MAITIHSWLKSSRNYEQGVDLYEKYGNSQVLLDMFRKGENSFTGKKLVEALRDISTPESGVSSITQSTAPARTASPSQSPSSPERSRRADSEEEAKKPTPIDDIKKRRTILYRERDYMKAALPKATKDIKREYCLKIMENTYEIDKLWKVIDHFDNTGEILDLKKEEELQSMDIYQLEKKILNARANVSKAKKRGNDELLAKWTAVLKEAEELKNKILNHAV